MQRHFVTLDLTIDETQAHFPEAGLLKLACDKALSLLDWTCARLRRDHADDRRLVPPFYEGGPDGIDTYSRRQLADYTELATERGLAWAVD